LYFTHRSLASADRDIVIDSTCM